MSKSKLQVHLQYTTDTVNFNRVVNTLFTRRTLSYRTFLNREIADFKKQFNVASCNVNSKFIHHE